MNNSSKSTLLVSLIVLPIVFGKVYLDQVNRRNQLVDKHEQIAVLGTFVDLKLEGNDQLVSGILREAGNYLRSLHSTINVYDPNSEASLMNRTAASSPFQCSDELWRILVASREAYQKTEGIFDVTAGPLIKLWGFYKKRSELPTVEDVKKSKALVGFDHIVMDDKMKTVYFRKKGMRVDFGGIAKGYALDRLLEIIDGYSKKHPELPKVESGLLNLGGNIYCFPKARKGKDFYRIGIRDPQKEGEYLSAVNLKDRFIATSGNYENFVVINGKRYTHIIDPRTGWPVEGIVSATVVTRRGLWSDVFSTALFVGGETLAKKLHRSDDVDYMLMYENDKGELKTVQHGQVWKN